MGCIFQSFQLELSASELKPINSAGSGEEDQHGSGEGDQPGSGEEGEHGSGEGLPDSGQGLPGSGEEGQHGSGEGDQPGSGEEGEHGSGEGDQPGSGEEGEHGSGEEGEHGSGEEGEHGSGEEGQSGSGEGGQPGSQEEDQPTSQDQLPKENSKEPTPIPTTPPTGKLVHCHLISFLFLLYIGTYFSDRIMGSLRLVCNSPPHRDTNSCARRRTSRKAEPRSQG